MSAETLRRAATEIRSDWDGRYGGGWQKVVAFNLAVADRLDTAAWQWEQVDRYNAAPVPTAGRKTTAHLEDDLAVANAYLGENR